MEAEAKRTALPEGEEISFVHEGDRVTLVVREDGLSLDRVGERGQSAYFSVGHTGEFRIALNDSFGSFGLVTHIYRPSVTEEAIHIRLGYDLCFTGNPKRFFLQIDVFDPSEGL